MYSIGAYYLSKNLIELPTSIIFPGAQLGLLYWAVGYRSDNWIPEFFQVWLIGFLLVQCALSYGYFISGSVERMESATAVAPLLTMPAIMFGGFFANSNTYIAGFGLLKNISPVYYANSAILLAQWRTDPGFTY
jgi:ABC-type multidrug transport system permease subunit